MENPTSRRLVLVVVVAPRAAKFYYAKTLAVYGMRQKLEAR
jgi:hypothetical protein